MSYEHLGIFDGHVSADRELLAKHLTRLGDRYTQERLSHWVHGAKFGMADADAILTAAANAIAEARTTATSQASRAALSDAWCEGVDAAFDGCPGSDEYASAFNVHAESLVNPYAAQEPKP